MRFRPALLLAAVCLTACSTFEDHELASFRAKRVPPPVYEKLSRGEALSPSDIIELTRRGVAETQIIRQLDDHGIDSLLQRADVQRMRRAGVSARVIDAALLASDEFARDFSEPRYVSVEPGWDYYDPWPGYGYGYGGVGFGFTTSRYYHRGRHWR